MLPNIKRISLTLLLLVALASVIAGTQALQRSATPAPSGLVDGTRLLAQLPADFVSNAGQWSAGTKFLAQQGKLAVALESNAIRLQASGAQPADVSLVFEGARQDALLSGEHQRPGSYNFYSGSDPAAWQTGVAAYGAVRYSGLYDGVDLLVRAAGGRFEYDLSLAAGASVAGVVIRAEGATGIEVGADGALVLQTAAGPLRQAAPTTWEVLPDGGRRAVAAQYRKIDAQHYGFSVPERVAANPLVIDPGLEWSTFLGGNLGGVVMAAQVVKDGSGDIVVSGSTGSTDFPLSAGTIIYPLQRVYVARLSGDGTTLRYATFLGGSMPRQFNWGSLALDAAGNAFIAGDTEAPDFPTTLGAYDRSNDGNLDAFVAKLDARGALTWSSFLGSSGLEEGLALGLDASGAPIVAGRTTSSGFPTTTGAFDTTWNPSVNAPGGSEQDAFITRFSADGSRLTYSTFLGGQSFELPEDLAVDGQGFVYIAGSVGAVAGGAAFPTTANALDRTWNGDFDGFFSRLKLDGAGAADLKYSTFLGGSSRDEAHAIAIDAANPTLVTVVGNTWSANFPTTVGVIKPTLASTATTEPESGFVTRFSFPATGAPALAWSTFLGGSLWDGAQSAITDGSAGVVVAGRTRSYDFPTTRGAYDRTYNTTNGNQNDIFVARISGDGKSLLYGTYLGGQGEEPSWAPALALAANNSLIIAGGTQGDRYTMDFPSTAGTLDPGFANGNPGFFLTTDGFIARLSLLNDSSGDLSATAPAPVGPANGRTFASNGRMLLDWADAADPAGVEGYNFQVSTRADFNPGFIVYRGAVKSSQVMVPPLNSSDAGLAINTPYYWRVQTADGAGNISGWSAASSFTMGVSSGAISLTWVAKDSATVYGGSTVGGMVGLTGPAPAGGAVVKLSSTDPAVVQVPTSVTIPAGATSANFPITTAQVWDADMWTFVVASYNSTQVAQIAVNPGPQNAAPFSVAFDPLSVTGGFSSSSTVTLNKPAPAGGVVVKLWSVNPAIVQVPASVTVPTGASSATFSVGTAPVASSIFIDVTAQVGPVRRTAPLSVITSNDLWLDLLRINPLQVTGGGSTTGTVTLSGNAPAGGVVVALSSQDASAATVPANVTVPAGATSASFTISTRPVATAKFPSIYASWNGAAVTETLTINPGSTTPPTATPVSPTATPQPPTATATPGSAATPTPTATAKPDTVSISRAEYTSNKKQLRVEATSSSSSATLQVFATSSNTLLGTLTNNGGGKYSGQLNVATNPQNITVRSSLGGSASKAVAAN